MSPARNPPAPDRAQDPEIRVKRAIEEPDPPLIPVR